MVCICRNWNTDGRKRQGISVQWGCIRCNAGTDAALCPAGCEDFTQYLYHRNGSRPGGRLPSFGWWWENLRTVAWWWESLQIVGWYRGFFWLFYRCYKIFRFSSRCSDTGRSRFYLCKTCAAGNWRQVLRFSWNERRWLCARKKAGTYGYSISTGLDWSGNRWKS